MKSSFFKQTDWDKLPLEMRTQIRQRERRVEKSRKALNNAVRHRVRFMHDEMLIPSTGRKKRRGRKWAKEFLLIVLVDVYLRFKVKKMKQPGAKVHIHLKAPKVRITKGRHKR